MWHRRMNKSGSISWLMIMYDNIDLLQPGMSFAEVTAKAHRLPEEFRALRYGVLAHGLGYVMNIRLSAILKMWMITAMTVK